MNRHHQVIVIGAGPAGAATAQVLARHGLDCAVIDKAVFPRDKLCGGLLTLRCQHHYRQAFDRPWDEVVDCSADGARFLHRGQLLNEVHDAPPMYFTRRRVFDQFLLDQALAAGAVPYLGEALSSLDLANKRVQLRSGAELGYDFLVGADGVNSLVAKTLFGRAFDPDTVAFALELEVARTQTTEPVTAPEIHFGLVRWGYGWVFPKRDSLTVGVGGLHRHNPDLKQVFQQFLAARFGSVPGGRIKGHHLPFGDYRRVPGRGDVLLCGDAAGLVEPITGEGIAFALQSGRHAAEAILEAAAADRPALPGYQARYQSITRDFDHANRLRWLLFPAASERLFLKALPRSRTLPHKHLELMADQIQYGDYFRYLTGRALKSLARRALFFK